VRTRKNNPFQPNPIRFASKPIPFQPIYPINPLTPIQTIPQNNPTQKIQILSDPLADLHGGSFSELLLPALGRPARFLRAGSHKSSTRTDFLPKETCRLTHGRNCGPSAAALPSSASSCTCGRDNSWWLAAAACCCSPTLVFE
jgi:hypothetical protein